MEPISAVVLNASANEKAIQAPSIVVVNDPPETTDRKFIEKLDSDVSWRDKIFEKLSGSHSLLSDIIETLKASEFFSSIQRDKKSRFWLEYDRVARQTDDEFLDRYNGDLDVQLIFAGLFSAVSSAFIIDIKGDLQPDPTDTTNKLLTLLVEASLNKTFVDSPLVLLSSAPPDRLVIWTQALGYISLALSLLAAFGAVLGKQWLGQLKRAYLNHGTLEQRGIERHERVSGIEAWHLGALLSVLPLMLQLSLLIFGISLTVNIYTEQHLLGILLGALVGIGLVFYSVTFLIGLCVRLSPFQTGLTVLVRKHWNFPKLNLPFVTTHRLWTSFKSHVAHYVALRPFTGTAPTRHSKEIDLEAVDAPPELPQSDEDLTPSIVSLSDVQIHSYMVHPKMVCWLAETTNDPDVLVLAAEMVPHVLWMTNAKVQLTIELFKHAFDSCFDAGGQLIGGDGTRAKTYFIAILHLFYLCIESSQSISSSDPQAHWIFARYERVLRNISNPRGIYVVINSIFDTSPGFTEILDEYVAVEDIHWVIHILNNRLHRELDLSSVTQFSIALGSDINVYSMYYGHILFGLAIQLGYKPEPNLLRLPDKREVELLQQLLWLLSHPDSWPRPDEVETYILYPLVDILSSIPSTVETLVSIDKIPKEKSISSIMALWLSILGEEQRMSSILMAYITSLIVPSRDQIKYSRLWKFYEAFESAIKLETQHTETIVNNIGSYKRDFETLLIFGVIKWPSMLLPDQDYIAFLIDSLDGSQPIQLRELAMQAAWCYRAQLSRIEDSGLRHRLLTLLIEGMVHHQWEVADILQHSGADNSFRSRLIRCCTMVRSFCDVGSVPLQATQLFMKKLEECWSLKNVIEAVVRPEATEDEEMTSSSYLFMVNSFEIYNVLKRTSVAELPSQLGDQALVTFVWHQLYTWCEKELVKIRERPTVTWGHSQDSARCWTLMYHACRWSEGRFDDLDSTSVSGLSSILEKLDSLFRKHQDLISWEGWFKPQSRCITRVILLFRKVNATNPKLSLPPGWSDSKDPVSLYWEGDTE